MPIIFISLSETYTEKIKQCGFEAKTMKPRGNYKLLNGCFI